ncbi:MAG: aminoacyl-tRNA hydrolase, partial [Paludibacteraceae bacterium]|nr:aminoacyl-tRNA hydrolase [Paludibacteraceae bacterium]
GKIRIKGSGSAGGHNGLKNIQELLGTEKYARLKFGIGNDFPKGKQVDFVLGEFSEEDKAAMPERKKIAADALVSFMLQGLDITMNQYNNK